MIILAKFTIVGMAMQLRNRIIGLDGIMLSFDANRGGMVTKGCATLADLESENVKRDIWEFSVDQVRTYFKRVNPTYHPFLLALAMSETQLPYVMEGRSVQAKHWNRLERAPLQNIGHLPFRRGQRQQKRVK